ncbi:AGL358Cp [Eremothecium gossypii ATCC 10895]|uniref:Mitochondrial escape protein 2 n=1 Tax=Eremothecium gossypii (strain ATCC 10895 / CBS 109.51 / FGSC 9923 / NRRL Y-1056) TaxID=284811 RepID=YME2_EREGS|nr:AGL358Cp [Eremothecium gossypii ATCC 10895]Q751P7.1 RecName: Full=Mitochondrial escape protein 2; Flags: Precursor [Eremothecium gossypii ATCC 10895]AAS54133.1 AGL358Cp [Eremothecium gossypii ATCC 10895]AEY98459.1 FAGL358Cp [Eremothecium gossypii FDAG1]
MMFLEMQRAFMLHGRRAVTRSAVGVRYISEDIQQKDAQAGEKATATATGVIYKSDEETLMYFDNVYPRATSLWRPTQWYNILLSNQSREAVREKIMRLASPASNPVHGLELRSTIPIKRDGGVFATFRVPREYTRAQVNALIQANTQQESSKSLLAAFTRAAAFPVKGVPWIEDLKRLPNNVVRVEVEGPALSEEELYSLFRRYGTILDIYPAGKNGYATIRYRSFRGAICAKNCVSGIEINGSTLHVKFEPVVRAHAIRDFFVNHPRIAIPLLIALLSICAVLIFDPIREFSIEQKITRMYTLSRDNFVVKSILRLTSYTVSSVKHLWGYDDDQPEKRQLWQERVEKVNDLKMWLEENNNTFVVVTGPRGSGKHELVMQHTLHDRPNVLYLDCDTLIKSRTDSKFLRNAAHQIGYFPIFPWLNSVTTLVDLAVQGLTGQKSGLSESKETQFRNMLNTAMMSIRHIALSGYKATLHSGDDVTTVKEEDYLQQHPERKPVIVIDRFSNKAEINGFVYKELADWASMLVQMNIAHVIFLTESVSPNQLLAEALPNQVFKFLFLSDASKDSARSYVLSQLYPSSPAYSEKMPAADADANEEYRKEIDRALEPIGGRMLDLQAFVRRVKSGEEPSEALEKMVEQASEQITQIFLSERSEPIKTAQAWELIELLSQNDVVKYGDIVFRPLFKSSPEAGLLELEKNGLITISRNRGVLQDIRPAKPLFKAAFSYLLQDKDLSIVLRTGYYLRLIAFETGRIKKWEEELRLLAKVSDQRICKSRLNYLASKIDASSGVINSCEDKVKEMSKRI